LCFGFGLKIAGTFKNSLLLPQTKTLQTTLLLNFGFCFKAFKTAK
jgi:hypothetical protein